MAHISLSSPLSVPPSFRDTVLRLSVSNYPRPVPHLGPDRNDVSPLKLVIASALARPLLL